MAQRKWIRKQRGPRSTPTEATAMAPGHWIRKRRGTWIIAVPPEVRRLLGVNHRMRLYWSVRRPGVALLATNARPKKGSLGVRELARELAAVRAELVGARTRGALRDRGMYAEGFANGYIQAYERFLHPHGHSAQVGRRRRRWASPDHPATASGVLNRNGSTPEPSEPRQNARRRRSQRVEVVATPVLELEPVRGEG